MFTSYQVKAHEGTAELIAFPVNTYLHKGVMRHFMDHPTAQAFAVFWPEITLPRPQQMSAGMQTELTPRLIGSRSLDLDETSNQAVYLLPAIRTALTTDDIQSLIQDLKKPEHRFQDMYPLEIIAKRFVGKMTGSPMFEQFRTSPSMQSLKRSRNGYARALSLSRQPDEATHLFSQLIDSVPVSQSQQIAEEVFQALEGISPQQLMSLAQGHPDSESMVRHLFHQIQKQTPLRTLSLQNQLENNVRPLLTQVLKVLSDGLLRNEVTELDAQQILVDKFPEFSAINPVDLSDILHQSWQFRSHAQRTECIANVLHCAANYSQRNAYTPYAQEVPTPEITVPGRPQLRPAR